MTIFDIGKLDERKLRDFAQFLEVDYNNLCGNELHDKANALLRIISFKKQEARAAAFLNRRIVGVSYSSKNIKIVNEVCNELSKQNNYELFFDQKNMQRTGWLIREFERELAFQKFFLVFLSADYLQSVHCMYELYCFYNTNSNQEHCRRSDCPRLAHCFYHTNSNQDHYIDATTEHPIPILLDKTIMDDDIIKQYESKYKSTYFEKLDEYVNSLEVKRTTLLEEIEVLKNIYCSFREIVYRLRKVSMINNTTSTVKIVEEIVKRVEAKYI